MALNVAMIAGKIPGIALSGWGLAVPYFGVISAGLMIASVIIGSKKKKKDDPHAGHSGHGGHDRGKLMAGVRKPGEPPVPVEVPDVPKLKWEMKDGAKEFHLHAGHLGLDRSLCRGDAGRGPARHAPPGAPIPAVPGRGGMPGRARWVA